MFELSFNNVKKYMDTNLILENISFQIYSGERVGIIGANGSGKSTILKLIAGILTLNTYPGSKSLGYDEGWIAMPKEATVAYLDQIPDYPDHLKVSDVLNLAFQELHQIENEMRQMEEEMKHLEGVALERLLKKYGDLSAKFETMGGFEMREKYQRICVGLNLAPSFLEKPFSLLSGGEKTTVELGKILMDQPDILLLDEPTNHLDLDAIEWLENYLKRYEGIVIIVSHDRYFLDHTVTKIIELEDRECMTFKGDYSSYSKQKDELMMKQFEDHKEQQKQIAAMEKAIKELRDWAIRADNGKFFKRAASIQNKLDRMNRIEKPLFDRPNMRLDLKTKSRSGQETLIVTELNKAYQDKKLFESAEMMVYYSERVAMVGPNGSGKTTLLKMLLGFEAPDSGKVRMGANVRAAYLPQHIVFEDENLSVLECLRDGIDMSEGKAREYLSKYMFYGADPFKKVCHLSGGERIRLKLAKLLMNDVNLLLLDEPTNHLDIESIETLEEALEGFKGTLFIISHDRYFLNKLAKRIIAIEDQKFKSYEGNYDAYKQVVDFRRQLAEEVLLKTSDKTNKVGKVIKPQKPKAEAPIDLSKVEAKITALEEELLKLDDEMAENAWDYENLGGLYEKRHQLNQEIEALMAFWMQQNEKNENI